MFIQLINFTEAEIRETAIPISHQATKSNIWTMIVCQLRLFRGGFFWYIHLFSVRVKDAEEF